MVFDFEVKDSSGRVIYSGQVHVDVSPFEQAKALAVATHKVSESLMRNQLTLLPTCVSIKIATIPIPQKG